MTTKKQSSVRHTRAIARDRTKAPTGAPPDDTITAHLTDLIAPTTYAQLAQYHAAGLRERVLTLPVMVAFVLSLIWRHIGSVSEAVRALNREGLLWTHPTKVSQQALSERLHAFPPALFKAVLDDVLPQMHTRAQQRTRPVPPILAWAQKRYRHIVAIDGSTLDSLLRHVGLYADSPTPVLAGRMLAVLDIVTHLPRTLFYEEDSHAHDQTFWQRIIESLDPATMLVCDLGFLNYAMFDRLTERDVAFVSRLKTNSVYSVRETLAASAHLRDEIVRLGKGKSVAALPMRVISLTNNGRTFRYVTNVTDPTQLPASYAAALYAQRWRIEEAFAVVKRLLGLAYVWAGSVNGIHVQLWATWLLYAVLVDLTDAGADALRKPFGALSMEMVYRGLYHYTQARARGETDDPIAYLADPANKDLGVLKAKPPAYLTHLEFP